MTLNNRTLRVLIVIAVVLIAAGVIARVSQAKRTTQYLQDLALEEPDKVMEAMTQLRERGSAIGARLVPVVTGTDKKAASRAAWLLGMVGSHAGDAALLDALKSEDPVLRIGALQSLGKLRVAEALTPATAIVGDAAEKPEVRCAAAYCLGMIGGKEVVAPLAGALATRPAPVPPAPATPPAPGAPAPPPPPPDTTISLRVAAVQALGAARVAEGLKPLAEAVKEAVEPSPEVRVAAGYALGDVAAAATDEANNRAAAEGLCEALKDKVGDVRIAAAFALGKVALPKDLEPSVNTALKTAEEDKHYWTRLAATDSHTALRLSD